MATIFLYYLHLSIVSIHVLFLISKLFFTTSIFLDNVYIVWIGLLGLSWIIFKECPITLLEKKHFDPNYKNGTCKLFFPFLRHFFGRYEHLAANIIKTILFINFLILSKKNPLIISILISMYLSSFLITEYKEEYCLSLRNQ